MAVSFVEGVEFSLDGDIVRVKVASGSKIEKGAMSIGVLMDMQIKGRAVIAQWHVRQPADVVPIAAGRRRG